MELIENSQVLKLIGLDEKNKWILQEQKASNFFEYITKNLDESNILTDSEIKEYEDLLAAGRVLNDDELEKEMKEIEIAFPGFFSVTDEKLEDMEEKIQKLQSEISERSDRISRMDDAGCEQSKEIRDLEKKSIEVNLQLKFVTEQCMEKAKQLTLIQKSNNQKVSNLNQIYIQSVSNVV